MRAEALVLAGSALLILAVGVLIRFGRVTVLIAGVGRDDDPAESLVDTVGTYTILVGAATTGMTALTVAGAASDRAWNTYAVAVVASAALVVAWATRGDRAVGG